MKLFLQRLAMTALALALLGACGGGPAIDRSPSTTDQRSRVNYLVLHDTVTDTPRSIRIFTHQTAVEASIHYLVSKGPHPVIYGIVDESRTACQAGGDAGWKDDRNLNNIAFQTRYRPANIDGEPDAETAALLDSPMRVGVRP